MDAEGSAGEMTVGQLGHRPGLHVSVNLVGKTIGGVLQESEAWLPGVVLGSGGDGTFVTVKLDSPIGGSDRTGFLHRGGRGQDTVQIDDPKRIRHESLAEAVPSGVPDEIVELAHAGKTLEAIRRYRALNGATLDEARAAIAKL
jgi:hypothetical protein